MKIYTLKHTDKQKTSEFFATRRTRSNLMLIYLNDVPSIRFAVWLQIQYQKNKENNENSEFKIFA